MKTMTPNFSLSTKPDFLRDKITVNIFELAFKYEFEIRISYVQSAANLSDRVSRKFDSIHAEWSLRAVHRWGGQIVPHTNVFEGVEFYI